MANDDDKMRKVLSEIEIVRETLYEAKNSSSDRGGKIDRALSRLKAVQSLYYS